MDQRNAGRSIGPLEPSDPWGAYARDQLALLDHLGVDRFHVMGACIGGSFALKLIEQAPARVAAAVLEQPVGITDGNGPLYEQMWRSWAAGLSGRADLTSERDRGVRHTDVARRFVVSVSRRLRPVVQYPTAGPSGHGPLSPHGHWPRDRCAGPRRSGPRAMERLPGPCRPCSGGSSQLPARRIYRAIRNDRSLDDDGIVGRRCGSGAPA